MSNCTTDLDCALSLICYTSPQWTSATNFCGCESWYGWVGENCLDLGSGSVVLFLPALVTTILAIITLALTLDQLRRTVKRHQELKGDASISSKYCFNTAAVTLGLLSVGLFGLICWRINIMTMITTPHENTLIALANGGVLSKIHVRIVAERVFVGITVLFIGCALLEVSLVWLEIAESSLVAGSVARAKKYRLVINGFQLFWALVYIICASLGQIALVTVFTLPVMFFVAITFVLARYVMNTTVAPLIQGDDKEDNPLKETFDLIERTTTKILICGSVGILGGAIYVILTLFQDYRDIIPTDPFVNAAAFFAELVPVAFLAASMVLLRNLYETQAEDSLVSQTKVWTKMASKRGIQVLSNIQSQASKLSTGGSVSEDQSKVSTNLSSFESVTEKSDLEAIL